MWQTLGLGAYLSLLALLQLLWPASQGNMPALVLVAGNMALYYAPRRGLYLWLLALAAFFDALYSSGRCLPAYALAGLLPLLLSPHRREPDPHQLPLRGWLRPLLMLQGTLLLFELSMAALSLPSAGWRAFAAAWQAWPAFWGLSMLAALILWPLSYALVRLLHYQRSAWHDEVLSGRLG